MGVLLRLEADREFRLDLLRPLVPWPPPTGVTITPASPNQVSEIARRRLRETGVDFEQLYPDRLQRGQKCFVATLAGEVIGCNWTCFGREPDGSLVYELGPDEVLTADAYTAVPFRGRSIHTALLHAMLSWAQQAGYARAYTYRTLGNPAALKALRLLDWQPTGRLRYVVLSSPWLCRRTGRCYELVFDLRRGPPVAPGPVLRRLPPTGRGGIC